MRLRGGVLHLLDGGSFRITVRVRANNDRHTRWGLVKVLLKRCGQVFNRTSR